MLSRMKTHLPDTPSEHHTEGRENISISVPHADTDDTAALFFSNSPAGSGHVLPYQETLYKFESNASSSVPTPLFVGASMCASTCRCRS